MNLCGVKLICCCSLVNCSVFIIELSLCSSFSTLGSLVLRFMLLFKVLFNLNFSSSFLLIIHSSCFSYNSSLTFSCGFSSFENVSILVVLLLSFGLISVVKNSVSWIVSFSFVSGVQILYSTSFIFSLISSDKFSWFCCRFSSWDFCSLICFVWSFNSCSDECICGIILLSFELVVLCFCFSLFLIGSIVMYSYLIGFSFSFIMWVLLSIVLVCCWLNSELIFDSCSLCNNSIVSEYSIFFMSSFVSFEVFFISLVLFSTISCSGSFKISSFWISLSSENISGSFLSFFWVLLILILVIASSFFSIKFSSSWLKILLFSASSSFILIGFVDLKIGSFILFSFIFSSGLIISLVEFSVSS